MRGIVLGFCFCFSLVSFRSSPYSDACIAAEVLVRETPEHGQAVHAKSDSAGAIHLIYKVGVELRYAKSTDSGESFSAPLKIVDDAKFPKGLEFTCWDMAVDVEGRVHVALGTNAWKLKRPQSEWGFYYTTLEPGQADFAPARNINGRPSEGYSLAVHPDGRVTACWLADKLYANVSLDHGSTFGETMEIDATLNPCNCCTTTCTYGRDGRLAILYREETNNERDMYLLLVDQKDNSVSKHKISSAPWKIDTCPMTYYAISPTATGYVAAWPTKNKVYAASINAQGTRSPAGEIHTLGKVGNRHDLRIFQDSKGQTVVLWKFEDQLGWQQFGRKWESTGLPGSAPSRGPCIAAVVTADDRVIAFR